MGKCAFCEWFYDQKAAKKLPEVNFVNIGGYNRFLRCSTRHYVVQINS